MRRTAATAQLSPNSACSLRIGCDSLLDALLNRCASKVPDLESMAKRQRLTHQSRGCLQRCAIAVLLFSVSTTLALTTRPLARAPSHLFRRTRGTRRWARKPSAPPIEQTEPASSRRNFLAAIAFPVGVGLGSQAPLLGLIANPPDATARDEMLSSWCAADYCTLLGGGAGYGGASAFPGNYVEPDE